MSKFLKALLATTLLAGPVAAEEFGLGREALPEEIAAWDIDVRPDGQGLPEGSGTAEEGEVIYVERCAVCHGDFGEARGRWPVLAGGEDSLDSEDPVKTVGSYWPYLSTVYDYVHRAMPFGEAQSLTADETYALTAYILYLNFLEDLDFELSRDNFAEVSLPNEDGFFMDDREETEFAAFVREPCMEDCKDTVEITKRAAVIDVTPEDAAARERVESAAEELAEAETTEAATTETAEAEAPAWWRPARAGWSGTTRPSRPISRIRAATSRATACPLPACARRKSSRRSPPICRRPQSKANALKAFANGRSRGAARSAFGDRVSAVRPSAAGICLAYAGRYSNIVD